MRPTATRVPIPPCNCSAVPPGQKFYRANNMGAGWLRLTGANHWTIGGDTDADGNVFIGPRVGIMLESGSHHITVRRNYSRHVYFGGWSQGNNFELGASDNNVLVEHNIVRDSSWAVRDVACEFRYNLVLGAGHQWMWITGDNAYRASQHFRRRRRRRHRHLADLRPAERSLLQQHD